MRFYDETLMAYADGELDADTRAAVDAAMANDPDLADAIALQIENRQALQAKLHSAFDGALGEEVPLRLLEAARSAPAAQKATTVSDLATVREAKQTQTSVKPHASRT